MEKLKQSSCDLLTEIQRFQKNLIDTVPDLRESETLEPMVCIFLSLPITILEIRIHSEKPRAVRCHGPGKMVLGPKFSLVPLDLIFIGPPGPKLPKILVHLENLGPAIWSSVSE